MGWRCAVTDQNLLSFLFPWRTRREPEFALAPLERSTAPDAPMRLFMRIQTANGPRTVIASGVTVKTATEISESLMLEGHYAEFVDECVRRDTVSERVRRRRLETLPKLHMLDRSARSAARG